MSSHGRDRHTALLSLDWLTWIPAILGLNALAALIGARPPWRAALGMLPLSLGLAAPFVAPPDVGLRFFLGLFSTVGAMVYVDLLREASPSPALVRVWMMLTPADVRRAERRPPRLSLSDLLGLSAYLLMAALGYWVAFHIAPPLTGPTHFAARWSGGLLFGYCMFDAVAHVVRLLYRAIGVELPPMHDSPFAARTISEFWSRRWNRTVNAWLSRHFFIPLARRRRPLLGIALAFFVSAAFHAWIFLSLGADIALSCGSFFVAQGALVLIERKLGVARWPQGTQRLWTLPTMLATTPLFLEPFLHLFEGAPR